MIISLADQNSLSVQPYTQKHKLRDSFQKCLHFWCGMGKKISHLKSTAIILNILSIKVKHTQQNTKKKGRLVDRYLSAVLPKEKYTLLL